VIFQFGKSPRRTDNRTQFSLSVPAVSPALVPPNFTQAGLPAESSTLEARRQELREKFAETHAGLERCSALLQELRRVNARSDASLRGVLGDH
jgi:hypothetical protein